MEEIDDEVIEKTITAISIGQSTQLIDDEIVIFKFPPNNIRQLSEVLYDKEYKEAIKNGLLDKKSLEKLIKERNLFSAEDSKQLDSLNSKLEGQRVLLSKTVLVKANQERIKKVIEELQQEIFKLTYKKTSKLSMSAEVKANEERILYLCWASTYDADDKIFWNSYKTFKTTTNFDFRDKVITLFSKFYSGVPTKTIRYIARSNMWRLRYITSQKTGEALFGVPTVNYTTDMLNLVYWSNYYDNIYQMMPEDRPTDLIIEDDDALDAYMKSYYEERNKEDAARRSKKRTPGKLSAFNSEEVIVTASNELWREIDYDKPKEAQKIKEKLDMKKRNKQG